MQVFLILTKSKKFIMKTFSLIIILTCYHRIWSAPNKLMSTEQKLVEDIFTNYSKSIRLQPTVKVYIAIDTKKLVSIDEKKQIMTGSFYIGQAWYDPRLGWNPLDYDNISLITVPADNIWIPDTYVINTADTNGYLPVEDSSFITLNKNGELLLITPLVTTNTRCKINTYSFPFDEQSCSIILSPWIHSRSKIILEFANGFFE